MIRIPDELFEAAQLDGTQLSGMDEGKPFNEKRALTQKENRLCIHKGDHLELMGGFEPPTSSLPRMRSTD